MSQISAHQAREKVDEVYRTESRRVFATLIRLLGDFELAEEALQDAFAAAAEQWPQSGVPANPRAWLVSAGRFKAIDAMRRRARFDASLEQIADRLDARISSTADQDDEGVEDDRLRLMFTCCHPALAPEAQVALTLREVCGLTTEEIASAFLVAPPTLAQRIVRAKAKIRDARIPYQLPSREDLPERLETVLQVIYLVFNEGYAASSGSIAHAARSVGRGDPPGSAAGGAVAGAGGRGAAGADAAARIAAGGADVADRRDHPARRPGPLAVEPPADCRGPGTCGPGAGSPRRPAVRPLHDPGGDRG